MDDNIKYEGNSLNLNPGSLEPHELQVSFPQKLFMLLENLKMNVRNIMSYGIKYMNL